MLNKKDKIMTTQTATTQTATTQTVDPTVVESITYQELIDILLTRSVELNGRGDIMVVDYQTDMLKKGKLRAAARSAFPDGLKRIVRATIQVNYDYGKKLENRTNGAEKAKGGPTWQRPVMVNGKFTAMASHKADFVNETDEKLITNARIYVRYEKLTPAQKAAGFGKNDFSRYETDNGDIVDGADVEEFYFDRPKQTVQHRVLTLGAVKDMKVSGKNYHIQQSV
ncbi:MAG: hypothetical protein P9M03_06855 [Candidatus Theseobacter exili]|nr:hypothetical protein [Candidatus Theseobacter exili]